LVETRGFALDETLECARVVAGDATQIDQQLLPATQDPGVHAGGIEALSATEERRGR